jgi:RNA polymerase sigma factor (sigma-70 family)
VEASVAYRETDESLTRRVAAGDRTAFDELYRRYAEPLARYGARMLRDREAGEDVAQTALLNAYRALESGVEPTAPRAWLYRIAHNTSLEMIRRRRDLPGEVVDERHVDPHETYEARGTLVAAMAALPERQRRAYLLREVKGLAVSEISLELELTVEQVEQALFAAKNKLAERLTFGDRLTCETVRGVDLGALSKGERRAVKGHLRGCPACRSRVSIGTGRLGLLGWLGTGLEKIGLLFGGSVAANVGAVAATTAVAGAFVAPPVVHALAHRPRAVAVASVAGDASSAPGQDAVFGSPLLRAFVRTAPPGTPAAPAAAARHSAAAVAVPVQPVGPPAAPVTTPATTAATNEAPAAADSTPADDPSAPPAADDPSADPAADDPSATAPADDPSATPAADDPAAAAPADETPPADDPSAAAPADPVPVDPAPDDAPPADDPAAADPAPAP